MTADPVAAASAAAVVAHERMLEQLEAERYTHSNESLAEVRRRVARERPETPAQVLQRRRHEERAAQRRQFDAVATAAMEARQRQMGVTG